MAEYRQAFGAFSDCVVAAGGHVDISYQDPSTGVVNFGVDTSLGQLGSGAGVNDSCYERYFSKIDIGYADSPAVVAAQTAQTMQYFRTNDQPCLELNGVAIPAGLSFPSEKYNQLDAIFEELVDKGECPGISRTIPRSAIATTTTPTSNP